MRLLATCVAVTLGVALSGCADKEPPDPVRPAPAPTGMKSGLEAKRFAALDRSYAAVAPLERFGGDARAYAVVARPARAACAAITDLDELVRSTGRYCSLGLDLGVQVLVFNGCFVAVTRHKPVESERACRRSFTRIPSIASAMQREARRSDRALRRSALAATCRRTLTTTPDAYAVLEGYVSVFGKLKKARSPTDLDPGFAKDLQRLAALGANVPPVAERRRDFRNGCG